MCDSTCDFEILLSCMNRTDFGIAYDSKVKTDLLIVSQCDIEDYKEMTVDGHLWRLICTTERGLSRSRNTALKNARGRICLFADDDEVFADNCKEEILAAFERNGDAAMIAFNVERLNNNLNKKYYVIESEKITQRQFGSPMTAIDLQKIKEKGLTFDERFGSGSDWGGGEDSLFQYGIRDNGLKIYESPARIASIDYGNGSQWFFGFDQRYFYNIGAFCKFRGGSKLRKTVYYIYFAFYKLRKDKTMSPFSRLKWLYLGEKGWKNNVPYKSYTQRKK